MSTESYPSHFRKIKISDSLMSWYQDYVCDEPSISFAFVRLNYASHWSRTSFAANLILRFSEKLADALVSLKVFLHSQFDFWNRRLVFFQSFVYLCLQSWKLLFDVPCKFLIASALCLMQMKNQAVVGVLGWRLLGHEYQCTKIPLLLRRLGARSLRSRLQIRTRQWNRPQQSEIRLKCNGV